jgi:hypothetical protein
LIGHLGCAVGADPSGPKRVAIDAIWDLHAAERQRRGAGLPDLAESRKAVTCGSRELARALAVATLVRLAIESPRQGVEQWSRVKVHIRATLYALDAQTLKRNLRRDVRLLPTLSGKRLVLEDLKAQPFTRGGGVDESALATETFGGRVETSLFEYPDSERNAATRLETTARSALTNLSGWTGAFSFSGLVAVQEAG